MAAIAAAALALQLLMGIAVAPNNWDSMTYHLARIGYWLQFDSALHFAGGFYRQLAQPPNGEFLQGWTLLLTGDDWLANTVQWVALVGIGATVGAIARVLRFDRPSSLFAASLFVTMPQPILQASSTQNDVIVSFFVVAALLFGLLGLRDRSTGDLVVFGGAVGLALGVKGTAILALPAIGVALAIAAWRFGTPWRFALKGMTATAAVGIIAFGSFNYVLNIETYGDPLGPVREATERTSPLGDNALRVAWTLIDSTGVSMPWLDVGLRRPVNKVFGDLTTPAFDGYTIASSVHEDTSAYGLLGMLGTLMLIVMAVRRRTAWDRRVVAAAAVGYFLLLVVTTEYNAWLGRVMMPGIAIGAPLLAALYRWGWSRGLAIAFAVLSLLPSLFVNPSKPLFVEPAQPTVLALDRIEQQTINRGEMTGALQELADRVAPNASLGLVRGTDSWDYSFFGNGLERRVVPLEWKEASLGTIHREGLEGIVFANVEPPPGLPASDLAPGYWLLLPRE